MTDDAIRHKFERAWGVSLPAHVGLPLTYVPDKVLREPDPKKRIHAYYIIGEDPAQSDPDLPEIRRTLSAIDLVIVQDIFFNKTCEYADVVFPATAWGEHNGVYTACDRRFQRVRKLIEPQPGCKTDWEILCLMATAMGYPMHYDNTEQIWDEMRSLCPKFAGASYEKWSRTTASSGPVRKTARTTRGRSISIKTPSSPRLTAKAISTTIPGPRPKSWKVPNTPCPCRQSAKSATTPSVP